MLEAVGEWVGRTQRSVSDEVSAARIHDLASMIPPEAVVPVTDREHGGYALGNGNDWLAWTCVESPSLERVHGSEFRYRVEGY
jgi:hypothetical protein